MELVFTLYGFCSNTGEPFLQGGYGRIIGQLNVFDAFGVLCRVGTFFLNESALEYLEGLLVFLGDFFAEAVLLFQQFLAFFLEGLLMGAYRFSRFSEGFRMGLGLLQMFRLQGVEVFLEASRLLPVALVVVFFELGQTEFLLGDLLFTLGEERLEAAAFGIPALLKGRGLFFRPVDVACLFLEKFFPQAIDVFVEFGAFGVVIVFQG